MGASWVHDMDIKLTLPDGSTTMPNIFFGKQPELRMWKLEAFEDSSDETPIGFESYAAIWRNVIVPRRVGKGSFTITVHARGVTTRVHWTIREPQPRRAKNVILFVGDGMALPMMGAARLVSRGMYQGKYKDYLHMEKLDHFGIQNPAGVDSIITDSANSASSFNSGHKSSNNALGVYADSGNDNFAHPKVETIAEHIKRKFSMGVGIVTTAELQDATPAAVFSHVRRRAEKAAITSQAINGCRDCVGIVEPDVMMGGGGKYFLPKDSVDGSNMYQNYSDKGYTVTHTRAEMKRAAKDATTKKLLTVTHSGNMDVWLDRNVYTDNMNNSENDPQGQGNPPTDQPNLDEMVMIALEILEKNPNGFFLMVEAASIDKSAHPMDVPRLLSDLIELDNTVGKVREWATKRGQDDTLIIATADHGHGFDVFGTVDTKLWKDAVKSTESDPVLDVDNYCSNVTDNMGTLFTVSTEAESGQKLRQVNRARRKAIGIYGGAGYPDYIPRSQGDGQPETWDVRTTLAAGMAGFPDHTTSYTVNKGGVKKPAFKLADGTYVNNPEDDPNGIFLSGNLPPSASTGVHTMQDVGIFASGPGADKVKGIMDNTEVYHIIAGALGFGTNGEIAPAATTAITQCMNDGTQCNCQMHKMKYVCSCIRGGPIVYVKDSIMCNIRNGDITPNM